MHVRAEAEAAIAAARDLPALDQARIEYLGRKAQLPNLLRQVARLPVASAPAPAACSMRRGVGSRRPSRRSEQLAVEELEPRLARDRVDVTLPADPLPAIGRLHLITQTMREIEDAFIGLGFSVIEAPRWRRSIPTSTRSTLLGPIRRG
jgi:phenylalanyl-tRNA synthetase alpha chain